MALVAPSATTSLTVPPLAVHYRLTCRSITFERLPDPVVDHAGIFYADEVLAKSLSGRTGWYWWTCRVGRLPDLLPKGPFASSYLAYRDTASRRFVDGLAVSALAGPPKNRERLLDEIRRQIS
jgi:hypothetical protein